MREHHNVSQLLTRTPILVLVSIKVVYLVSIGTTILILYGSLLMMATCIEDCGLLALHVSTSGSSWQFDGPLQMPLRQKARRSDASKDEIELEASLDFSCSGGGRLASAEMEAWKSAFLRKRVAMIVRGAQSMLAGKAPDAAVDPVSSRKKDAPDPRDREGVQALADVQAQQATLVRQRSATGRLRKLVAAARKPIPSGRQVWAAPSSVAPPKLAEKPRFPYRRAVVDNIASASECAHAIGAAILGMDGCDDSQQHVGESTLVVRSARPPHWRCKAPTTLHAIACRHGHSTDIAIHHWTAIGLQPTGHNQAVSR